MYDLYLVRFLVTSHTFTKEMYCQSVDDYVHFNENTTELSILKCACSLVDNLSELHILLFSSWPFQWPLKILFFLGTVGLMDWVIT